MSMNINQVFIANPITSNISTDLMYFGQSPYGAGNDAAMTYANFSAQFSSKTLTNAHFFVGNASNAATDVAMSGDAALSNAGAVTVSKIGGMPISLAGSFTTSGAFAVISTYTGITNLTYPTTGTLATTSQLLSSPLTTKGDIWGWSTTNARIPVGTTDGQILQVSSGAAVGIAYSTPTYPSASGAAGVILRSNGTNNIYSTSTFADTYAASTILYSNGANAVTGLATANSSVLVTTSTGVPIQAGTMTNGQIIIGSTGATPAVGTITGSGNISVTVGAGTLALSLTGSASFSWNDVSGTSQAATINNGYIISNASQTTVTLPATAAEGTVFSVQGKGAAGWILQANTGQVIHLGSSATSSAGSLTSTNQWDSVSIVCVTANTTFAVTSVIGNLTVA